MGSWFVRTQSTARKAWHLEGLTAVAVRFHITNLKVHYLVTHLLYEAPP